MYNDKKILAIIPARGGSKRLKNKNILKLGDKPLVSWTIEASINSKYIDETVVSSDLDKILDIANGYGLNPLKRPGYLAQDITTSIDVVIHTIDFYRQEKFEEFDYIILLQPTSPFRNYKHIDEAIESLFSKNADAVISVCESEHSPIWTNTLKPSLCMENFIDKRYLNYRSQDLDTFYRLNGAIYICNIEKLLKEKTLFIEKNIFAYKMSQEDSVDIDTKLDFLVAQVIIKEKNE